jgi:hypothetical protein
MFGLQVSDSCHSGSLLDQPKQQISGDKAKGSVVASEVDAFKGLNVCSLTCAHLCSKLQGWCHDHPQSSLRVA